MSEKKLKYNKDVIKIMDRCLRGIEKVAYTKRTICEMHREILDIVKEIKDVHIKDEIQARVIIAYDMGKRMEKKLREYKKNWDKDFWEKNEDFEQDKIKRGKRK